MKKTLKRIWNVVRKSTAVKYVVVAVLAVVMIGFVDENSAWNHFRNKRKISELESEIQRYTRLNKANQEQIRLLDSDPKAIEKIARERYFMKADDEDIFVLSDDKRTTDPLSDETTE